MFYIISTIVINYAMFLCNKSQKKSAGLGENMEIEMCFVPILHLGRVVQIRMTRP